MGSRPTQVLGAVLGGYMRNIPEAHASIEKSVSEAVPAAGAEKDGPFKDCSHRARD